MEKNTAYAYLSIDNFSCPVTELTKRIGLQPTKAWSIGDIVLPLPIPRTYGAWHLKSRIPGSEEVERHVVDVLEQIRGREAVFREIAQEYSLRMQCVGYYNEDNPGFSLDADIIRRIAECGMKLDLDSYHFYTENEKQEAEGDHT